MEKRDNLLNKTVKLVRNDGESNTTESFEITDFLGGGGSCLCYSATRLTDNKIGFLKEFYPMNLADNFERSKETNGLFFKENGSKEFENAKADFYNSYDYIRNAFKNGSIDLNYFIPDFTIYHSHSEDDNELSTATYYIWSTKENIMVFDDYIKSLHETPSDSPEYRLYTLLSILISLTKSVQVIQESGFLHLDIKPSNFGVKIFKNEPTTDAIYLFDINTIYKVGSESSIATKGTCGYSSPELRRGSTNIDYRADVYSIGCVLYSCLTGELKGYNDNSRDSSSMLEEAVKNSRLITASETTSNKYLIQKLYTILKSCLSRPLFYNSYTCENLVTDFETARGYLLSTPFTDEDESFSFETTYKKHRLNFKNSDNELVILNHLYNEPIYKFRKVDSNNINVAVIGFGNIGQIFMDSCLQVGQIDGININVTAYSDNMELDKAIYLKDRPALKNFFCIDESSKDDNYGTIKFENLHIEEDNLNKDFFNNIDFIKNCDYIFISLGKQSLNEKVAEILPNEIYKNASVNYANYNLNQGYNEINLNQTNKVIFSNDFKETDSFKDLERQGFNSHLIWNTNFNISIDDLKKEFNVPYNYLASMANVISIKYKLYGIGLDINKYNDNNISELKNELENDKSIFNRLVASEHRRWNVEKICKGWVTQTKKEEWLNGKYKDNENKKHICLVKSRPDTLLQNCKNWDTIGNKQSSKLDELDNVSLNLHKNFLEQAEKDKAENILSDEKIENIQQFAEENKAVLYYFTEWYSCLEAMWNGSKEQVKKFYSVSKAFKNALNSLNKGNRDTIITYVNDIESNFYHIIESLKYTDYKKIDEDLIYNIPFILFNNPEEVIAVPLVYKEENCADANFKNIFSTIFLNPKKVFYLYEISDNKDVSKIESMIENLRKTIKKRRMKIESQFVLLNSKGLSVPDDLNSTILYSADELKSFLLNQRVTLIENRKESVSERLLDTAIPYFKIDSKSGMVTETVGCNYLKLKPSNQSFKIADMLSLSGHCAVKDDLPNFHSTYKELWEIYTGNDGKNKTTWKNLCNKLKIYCDENQHFSFFDEVGKFETQIYLPAFTFKAAKKILDYLKNEKIISSLSNIKFQNVNTIKISVKEISKLNKDPLDRLFKKPYLLTDALAIKKPYSQNGLIIDINSLNVNKIKLSEKYYNILKALQGIGLISSLSSFKDNDEKYQSFNYTSHSSKELMTLEGKILEIYVYHKCLDSGEFSDIATSLKIKKDQESNIKNEIDIMLTKGYQSVFIECKARNSIDDNFKDYYDKLLSNMKTYGVNSTGIMVVDTDDDNISSWINYGNSLQPKIHTILNEDIEKIDEAIKELLQDSTF